MSKFVLGHNSADVFVVGCQFRTFSFDGEQTPGSCLFEVGRGTGGLGKVTAVGASGLAGWGGVVVEVEEG